MTYLIQYTNTAETRELCALPANLSIIGISFKLFLQKISKILFALNVMNTSKCLIVYRDKMSEKL